MSRPGRSDLLSVYVVDDEPLATRRLVRLLAETGRVDVAGSANDPEEALEYLSRHQVDAVFLDIQMPEMNGFELLARLEKQPLVVFITAYDQYALRAFEVHSVDYLLKPVDTEQLERALSKLERIQALPLPELEAEIALAMERVANTFIKRIASRLGDKIRIIDIAEISHFYAENKLTHAVAAGKSYVVDESISALERKLDPRQFVRIHRATLVNLDFVTELQSTPGGGALVGLEKQAGTTLTVARDRVRRLKDRLGI